MKGALLYKPASKTYLATPIHQYKDQLFLELADLQCFDRLCEVVRNFSSLALTLDKWILFRWGSRSRLPYIEVEYISDHVLSLYSLKLIRKL